MAPEKILLLQVIITFSILLINAESASLSITTDKEALLSIKSQLTGLDHPNPLSSWDQYLSPCNWTRVVCDQNRVIELDLSGLELSGSISPHIGNLSFLMSLQLQNNQLTGSLPEQLGNLFRLRLLNASFNSFTGAIPANISRCKELRTINLMQNEISEEIPLGMSELGKLQVLNLAQNRLSGPFPSSVLNISTLIDLNLGTNAFGGPIPSELSGLQNLQYLDLSINNFTGTVPPSIYNISSLVYLTIASNDLWGELPSSVGVTLPNLLLFRVCINKFTGTIPGSLHNLTRIRVIRMSHNLLQGNVPPGLGNLPDLEMYNIGFNRIVGSSGSDGFAFLELLTNSTRLTFLAIDSNLIEGAIPQSVGNFSRDLKIFYMGGNRVYGKIPSSIGQLRGLELLDMSFNSIEGQIPQEIGQLLGLQFLGLGGNLLSGKIPDSLGNLLKLIGIDLSRNNLMGSIPTNFNDFPQLVSLDLSNNKLNGSITKEFFNLPSLGTFLNLSNNYLTGSLPAEVGLLKGVAAIDISDNHLSSGIPNSIGDCKSLQHLSLARNFLSGLIPDSLGDARGLESLDLSSNQLSGSIPFDLQNLQELQVLNLSFNNLAGGIPRNGVFADPSRVHLEGNKNICLQSTCKKRNPGRNRLFLALALAIIGAVSAVAILFVALTFHMRKGKAKIQGISESFRKQYRMISYHELRLATNDFDHGNLVGAGSFGSVYKGQLRDGTAIAVKVIDIDKTGSVRSFSAECAALRNTRHRNLIKLITTCSSIDFRKAEFLALIFEFMTNGSLEDWITGKRRTPGSQGLNLVDRLNVAIDVASAINYLHHECENPVVHCDLKPSNVLLDSNMTAKVGDLGLARTLLNNRGDPTSISSTHTLKGSIGYIPPEYGFGEKPSTAGDVYSYGIMLLELFTGRSPRHESFMGGLSLRKWVQMNFPNNIEKVLDQELIVLESDFTSQDGVFINRDVPYDCLFRILGIGLSCTADSPDERISMRDVLPKLEGIRGALVTPN